MKSSTRCVLLEIDEINRFLLTLFHQIPLKNNFSGKQDQEYSHLIDYF